MTIANYLRILRDQWVVVVVAVLVCLAAGATFHALRPVRYTAQLTLYVSSQGVDSTSAAFQGAQLSQQRVASYVKLVTTPRVSQAVVKELKLPMTYGDLAQEITASTDVDSVLIYVRVTDASPARAADIANAVGTVFTGVVNDIEEPLQAGGVQAVAVRVVQPAIPPTGPSSTGLPVTLAASLVIGLVLGVGGALLRSGLDTSVRSPDDLARATGGAPALGVIARDSAVPKRPLLVQEDAQSPRTEAFRQLRTNLRFINSENPAKVLVVVSSLAAEGKTTTLVNLAIILASGGSRVLVIEADLRRPKAADLFGLERSVGLSDVLTGGLPADDVIQSWHGGLDKSWHGGLVDVLPSGQIPPNPSELLGSARMAGLLRELRDRYDFVLLDTPPLLPVTDAADIAAEADGALLVCRYRKTKAHQVAAAVRALQAVSAPVLGTIFSMVPRTGSHAYAQYNAYYRTKQSAGGVQPDPRPKVRRRHSRARSAVGR